jgi:plastocyanin
MIIAGLVAVLSLPNAYSDFSSDKKYLIQASGYLTGKQTIYDSTIALQLGADTWTGSNLFATLDNGIITISGNDYLNSGTWQTTILRYGKYLVIKGDAQDLNGDTINVDLFARMIDSNQDGSVYSITGKITAVETLKVIFSSKITEIGAFTTQPSSTTPPGGQSTPSTQPGQTQPKTIQMTIVSGASNIKTGQPLYPSSVQVTPGSTVIFKNNDLVPHRMMSGYSQTVTQGSGGSATTTTNALQFTPDGLYDSGTIAPGQTYQITINGIGTTLFFDPTYTWINGAVTSISQTTQSKPIQVSILPGSSVSQGAASQQNQFYQNGYYSPSDIQIVPGTTVIWVNNDSVAHRILSGVSTQKSTNPFIPDGKIDSGVIPSGQSFQVTINGTGIIRFFDPTYDWMNGVIVSLPPSSSHTIAAPSHNPSLH